MKVELTLEGKLDKPWWNRPLLGEKTLIDYIFSQYIKADIPQDILFHYNSALEKIESTNVTLKALLSEKFIEKDFLTYARIQSYLDRYCQQKQHYFVIAKEFFKILLDNLDTLFKIKEIEAEYNSPAFLEFYQNSLELFQQQENKLIFQEKLRKSISFFIKQLNEENEQKTMKLYMKYLFMISDVNNLGTFFYLLKTNELEYWQLLKKIKDFIEQNKAYNIEDLKPFVLLVKSDDNLFREIATQFLRIKKDDTEDFLTMARILQYITLSYKYEAFYSQFQLFLSYLSKWEKTYYYILHLKNKYPNSKYNYPSNFKVKLPGFDLYKSYYDYLDTTYSIK
ncbi:hypothetical protein GM3708_1414 [Geminocystis sp. NIES-3708]|uniref:hypothetical protein n=1 Tax=Geminocystis sp. NIES-3708 TaxID=1615909 RepID=UPI0005FC5896|nr:hypothetical protein [Geminocystis sp. NIES-3708]BAQ61008.1 hypothetical protein GM3708_1414 [Geminocystis sp. NIES-3708]